MKYSITIYRTRTYTLEADNRIEAYKMARDRIMEPTDKAEEAIEIHES